MLKRGLLHLPAPLRRGLGRIGRGLSRRRIDVVYSPDYQIHLPGIPHDTLRGERILGFLHDQGLLPRRRLHRPREVPVRSLRRAHDDDYLDSVWRPGGLTQIFGFDVSPEEQDRALTVQRQIVGGTLLATHLALESGGAAINLGGGFHHARPDRGKGFCIFNDVAVAIADLRRRGFEGRILVIDLDLHDGDGTRIAFANDPSVYTFSIHNRHWDTAPAVASTAVELGAEVEDAAYLAEIRELLPAIVQEHRPELVFYLAGVDPAADDDIGNWTISPPGLLARDLYVVSQVQEHLAPAPPMVVLLAGGYGEEAWRYSARFFGRWLTGSRSLEPPATEDMALARYRRLARELAPGDLTSEPTTEEWGLTDEDVYGGLGMAAKKTRYLSYYTKHGIELALERLGILDRMRELGFESPRFELDLENPNGETVRVFADESGSEPLVELRVQRDKSSLPGFELLRVDWLLLQNPRESFSSKRPRLPGQKHPGLGMLKDIFALQVLVCERLELDGILFTPSHFHLAHHGRSRLFFLRPKDEARFLEIEDALAGLSLDEADRALAEGRLVDSRTGEAIGWQPQPMVLPVSDRLREMIEAPAYREEVQQGRIRLQLALRPAR